MKAILATLSRDVRLFLHLCVLAGGILLIVTITMDTLGSMSYVADQRFLRLQFWVCIGFIADVFIDSLYSPRHWHYLLMHTVSILICVPWFNIITHFGLEVPHWSLFILRFLPMVRAAVVVGEITAALTRNRAKSLLTGYLTLLVAVVYFGSVMFFVEEHAVNPGVHSFRSALYWSIMTMTTTGCDIPECTVAGRILCSVLSGMGLVLFPVFTVYISDAVSG